MDWCWVRIAGDRHRDSDSVDSVEWEHQSRVYTMVLKAGSVCKGRAVADLLIEIEEIVAEGIIWSGWRFGWDGGVDEHCVDVGVEIGLEGVVDEEGGVEEGVAGGVCGERGGLDCHCTDK